MRKSLNQVIREYLEQLAGQDQAERDIKEFQWLSGHGKPDPDWTFDRDEIYDRKTFGDTSALVYADDLRDSVKQARAAELIAAAFLSRLGPVSTQVLQEYFSAATMNLRLDAGLVRTKVELLAAMSVVQVDPPLILAAIDLHRFSIWDPVILQAAVVGGCRELLSEDMQPGLEFRHGGVVVANPSA
jgi:predicted nucleic acid-binding protein